MKKSKIIEQINNGVMIAHGALPCVAIIAMFILHFIDEGYMAVFGFMFCAAYGIEVLIALEVNDCLKKLEELRKKDRERC